MALSQRKRLILVKLEPTYGIDSVPSTTDAVLCKSLNISPLEGSSVERGLIRPYFSNEGGIRVEDFVSIDFETELAGSGTAGTAPKWGALLKACNFSETITPTAITTLTSAAIGAVASTSVTLSVAASAVDDFYTGMTITFNGLAAQSYEIIKYVGATKIATLGKGLLTAITATSTTSISPNVIYTPNSNFGTNTASTSASIYFNLDGVRHVLLGARGTVSFDLSLKAVPAMKWKFTGLLGTISDVAQPGFVDMNAWQTPVTISSDNTSDVNVFGYNFAVIEKLSFDIANTVAYRQTLGSESVLITDRKPVGSLSLEAGYVSTLSGTTPAKDWWTAVRTSATSQLCIKHGQIAGNIVGFSAPKVQLLDPKYSDSNGVVMLDMNMALIPYGQSGNDEIRICSK
jgi:hypothetical protein